MEYRCSLACAVLACVSVWCVCRLERKRERERNVDEEGGAGNVAVTVLLDVSPPIVVAVLLWLCN